MPSTTGFTAARFSFNDRLCGMCSSMRTTATCIWHECAQPACEMRAYERETHASSVRCSGSRDLALFVRLDDVAAAEVLEVGQPDAALEAGGHLADVVLEPLERLDGARPDHDA